MELYVLEYNYYYKEDYQFTEVIGIYDSYEKLLSEKKKLIEEEKYDLFENGHYEHYNEKEFEDVICYILNKSFIRR